MLGIIQQRSTSEEPQELLNHIHGHSQLQNRAACSSVVLQNSLIAVDGPCRSTVTIPHWSYGL